jgi:hypothetical protein
MSAAFIEVGDWTVRADRVEGWGPSPKGGTQFRLSGTIFELPDLSPEKFGRLMRQVLPEMFGGRG